MNEFDDLEDKYARGEISYDELVRRGEGAVERLEKRCVHDNRTTEATSNGGWVTWCGDCGARVESSGGARTVKAGSGCAVVTLTLLGAAAAAGYGAIEAIRHLG